MIDIFSYQKIFMLIQVSIWVLYKNKNGYFIFFKIRKNYLSDQYSNFFTERLFQFLHNNKTIFLKCSPALSIYSSRCFWKVFISFSIHQSPQLHFFKLSSWFVNIYFVHIKKSDLTRVKDLTRKNSIQNEIIKRKFRDSLSSIQKIPNSK